MSRLPSILALAVDVEKYWYKRPRNPFSRMLCLKLAHPVSQVSITECDAAFLVHGHELDSSP